MFTPNLLSIFVSQNLLSRVSEVPSMAKITSVKSCQRSRQKVCRSRYYATKEYTTSIPQG